MRNRGLAYSDNKRNQGKRNVFSPLISLSVNLRKNCELLASLLQPTCQYIPVIAGVHVLFASAVDSDVVGLLLMSFLESCCCLFLNGYGAQESIPRNKFRQPMQPDPVFVNLSRSPGIDFQPGGPDYNPICRTGPPGYIGYIGSLNRFLGSLKVVTNEK